MVDTIDNLDFFFFFTRFVYYGNWIYARAVIVIENKGLSQSWSVNLFVLKLTFRVYQLCWLTYNLYLMSPTIVHLYILEIAISRLAWIYLNMLFFRHICDVIWPLHVVYTLVVTISQISQIALLTIAYHKCIHNHLFAFLFRKLKKSENTPPVPLWITFSSPEQSLSVSWKIAML